MTDIEFFLKALELKDEKRTGPQLYNIEEPETVAGHSWSTALLVLIYGQEQDIDLDKALKMALIHDMAEAETGDLPTRALQEDLNHDKEDKHKQEQEFWRKHFPNTDLEELWREYEERETDEAIFVKEMDLIDLCLTALKYEKQERYDPDDNQDMPYRHMDEFFETAEPRIKTELGEKLLKKLKARYEKVKQK